MPRCRQLASAPSMGSVGDAYDNAMCESFFATLECELLARIGSPHRPRPGLARSVTPRSAASMPPGAASNIKLDQMFA